MDQPAKPAKRSAKARMEKARAHCNSQAAVPSKKQVDKMRRAFSNVLLRAMKRARKRRLAINTTKRASRSGADGSCRQQGNKMIKKKAAPRAVKKVVDTLVKGHLNIKKADEAVIEELQKQLKESQDEVSRLNEDEAPPYEQKPWEVPILPDDYFEDAFTQEGTEYVTAGELFKQASGASFY